MGFQKTFKINILINYRLEPDATGVEIEGGSAVGGGGMACVVALAGTVDDVSDDVDRTADAEGRGSGAVF